MNATESTVAAVSGQSARWLVSLNLVVFGGGFAWFAYIDAPITDGALRVFAGAVLAGLVSMVAALISGESRTEKAARRSRRVALWLFAVATALMLTAATVTLNLKGTGSDEADTQTAVVMPA